MFFTLIRRGCNACGMTKKCKEGLLKDFVLLRPLPHVRVLTGCRGAPINIGIRAFITQLVKPLQEEISHKVRGSKFLHIIIKLSECVEECSDF